MSDLALNLVCFTVTLDGEAHRIKLTREQLETAQAYDLSRQNMALRVAVAKHYGKGSFPREDGKRVTVYRQRRGAGETFGADLVGRPTCKIEEGWTAPPKKARRK